MRQRHAIPDSHISTAAVRSSLSMLLTGATDERLQGFTVERLGRAYRLPPKEIERMLGDALARMRRRG